MQRRPISIASILAVLIAGLMVSGAAADDVYSERTLDIARQLQCPICDGQSVADSQVTLAQQMRDVIEQKVQAGESNDQIMAYFTDRYGERVLLDPPKSGFNMTLWWIPPAVLAVGALVVVLYMREGRGASRSRLAVPRQDPIDDELESLAREYLHPDTNTRSS